MSQRNVEMLIGRLLTDECLRRRFIRAPYGTIEDFCRQGWTLSQGEVDALAATDARTWTELATRIPSRLQRARLDDEDVSTSTSSSAPPSPR